jgi:hypothetical protein
MRIGPEKADPRPPGHDMPVHAAKAARGCFFHLALWDFCASAMGCPEWGRVPVMAMQG